MQKQNKCLKCEKCFMDWEYAPHRVLYGKFNNRPLYTCEECMEDLNKIENWGNSKIYKNYCRKEKRLLTRIIGKGIWTTICPTKDVTLETLHKKIIKLNQGCIIKKGWWSYEWRHNLSNWNGLECDIDNNGLHCHIYNIVNNVNSWKTKVKRLCNKSKKCFILYFFLKFTSLLIFLSFLSSSNVFPFI